MDKKTFIFILEQLLDIKKDVDNFNDALNRLEPDFRNYISFGRYETLVVDTLKSAMNDKDDWIGYFLYERDAKFTRKNIINDKDGKNVPFRNMDDLYELIIRK